MQEKKENTGIGEYQKEKAFEARMSIMKALSDGEWHRFNELKEKIKPTPPTLSKYLKEAQKDKIVERRQDNKSGEYPPPVYYKLKPYVAELVRLRIKNEHLGELLKKDVLESKNKIPIDDAIISGMNGVNQVQFLAVINVLQAFKKHKEIDLKVLREFTRDTVWNLYENLTWNLIDACIPFIDEITLDSDKFAEKWLESRNIKEE